MDRTASPQLSVACFCYNEEENLESLYAALLEVFRSLSIADYEIVVVDNGSTDRSPEILRRLAASDACFKPIFATRNFGSMRSQFHALTQSSGAATVLMACDFQDPPALIAELYSRWRKGARSVLAIKSASDEPRAMFALRRIYYGAMSRISDMRHISDFTGFGIYDRSVVNELAKIRDSTPYLRGLIAELGLDGERVQFTQPRRARGVSKNRFYDLFDMAMLGMTRHSRAPLRAVLFLGLGLIVLGSLSAALCLVLGGGFSGSLSFALASLASAIVLMGGVQLVAIGVLGEYLSHLASQSVRRPCIVERERLNF